MTTHTGNEGTIKVGGVVVAEIRTIQVDMSVATVDDTVVGDDAETHKALQTSWTAQADVLMDPDDAAQGACEVGQSVTIDYFPVGTDSGLMKRSGTATVEKRTEKGTYNGMLELTIQFKGNGALSKGTV